MKTLAKIVLVITLGLAQAAYAKQVKEVAIVAAEPVPVELGSALELAPGQSIEAEARVYVPGEIVVLQSFLATTSAQIKTLLIPTDMVLQTVTVVPAAIDSDPGLANCSSTLRWPRDPSPIHPASMDRIIVDHRWPGATQVTLNHAMAYKIFLQAGSTLQTSVGRVGSSGFCSALVIVTGTTL